MGHTAGNVFSIGPCEQETGGSGQGSEGRSQGSGVREAGVGRQESEVRNQELGGKFTLGSGSSWQKTAAIRRKSKLSKGMESKNPKSLIKKGLRIKPAAFLPPLPLTNLPQSVSIASIAPFFCRFGAAEAAGQVKKSGEVRAQSGERPAKRPF